MTTPRHKTRRVRAHTESEIEFNRTIASRRASVERVITHIRNWKLPATPYRGPLDRFPALLDAIVNSRSTEHHRPSTE